MTKAPNTAPTGVEDLQQRCEAAQTTFLTGVAHWLALEEAVRARQAGEEPSEERVHARLREMTDRVEVRHG